jgi:hypothetical protein
MSVDHVISTPVTNLRSGPGCPNTEGEGARATCRNAIDVTSPPFASSSADATYRLVRIPSTAKVKSIIFESEAQARASSMSGVYYPITGRNGVADLLVANAVDQDFFATIVDCASAVTRPT